MHTHPAPSAHHPEGSEELWVFGYGSLMWNPGFVYQERHIGILTGYHRALCVYSHVHRGTPEKPGLVLGLDRGGSCRGYAFRVAESDAKAAVTYLRAREQVTSVYIERRFNILLNENKKVTALAYVVDRMHRQYAGRLHHHDLVRIVQQGQGQSGANPDYVLATHDHLTMLGIKDAVLSRISEHLRHTPQQ